MLIIWERDHRLLNNLGILRWISLSISGSFIGISKALKEYNPNIDCLSIEPTNVAFYKNSKLK